MRVEIQRFDEDRNDLGKEIIDHTTIKLVDIGKFKAMLSALYGQNNMNVTVMYKSTELTGLDASRLIQIDQCVENEGCIIRYCKVGKGGVYIRYAECAVSESDRLHTAVPLLVVNIIP